LPCPLSLFTKELAVAILSPLHLLGGSIKEDLCGCRCQEWCPSLQAWPAAPPTAPLPTDQIRPSPISRYAACPASRCLCFRGLVFFGASSDSSNFNTVSLHGCSSIPFSSFCQDLHCAYSCVIRFEEGRVESKKWNLAWDWIRVYSDQRG